MTEIFFFFVEIEATYTFFSPSGLIISQLSSKFIPERKKMWDSIFFILDSFF